MFELPVNAGSLVFSSPDMTGGAAYTISYGGDYDGQSADGICSGGTYSGGTDLTELTLTDYITTYGNRVNMGNPGGRHGGIMGGAFGGKHGEFPADGTAPDMRPDSQVPEDGGTDSMPENSNMPGKQGNKTNRYAISLF